MTLKGAERRAVVLKTSESALFEEAVFLMRSMPERKATEEKLAAEAGRIVEESLIHAGKNARRGKRMGAFLFGLLLGCLPGFLFWLLSLC